MENLEMFEDILGASDMTQEEIKEVFLKSFDEAIRVIEKHMGEEEGKEFGEFVKEYQEELIQMHFDHFTHEELVYLVKLETDPVLLKIRDFQQNIMAPKMEKHIADFIDKKAKERYGEQIDAMKAMEDDGWSVNN
jgi:hypothetical protein